MHRENEIGHAMQTVLGRVCFCQLEPEHFHSCARAELVLFVQYTSRQSPSSYKRSLYRKEPPSALSSFLAFRQTLVFL